MPHEPVGRALLVGAGPGAADLLTMRALRAIQSADIVIHDALVGADVLALIPAHVRRIEVGKRGHRLSTHQDFINRLMARLARGGATVVRLKGGDPSLFGRAAEERAFLEARGVKVEVIPGITAASAAAAQFGFSLTKRDAARSVLFATGRTAQGARLDWRAAADPDTTLCLYMGCADLETIAAELMASGRPADTPATAAIDVERPHAQLIICTLAELATHMRAAAPSGPVLIVIGPACADARVAQTSPPAFGRTGGLLLAGGRSSRFGTEKAVARFGSGLLMDTLVEKLNRFAHVAVSAPACSRAAARAAALGAETLHDDPTLASGPLAGVLEGLKWAQRRGLEFLATVPCDAPLLPRDLFPRLFGAIGPTQATFAVTSAGKHPLCAVWRASLLEPLEHALAGGAHPSVCSFLTARGARRVYFRDARAFANANTADTLAALEARA